MRGPSPWRVAAVLASANAVAMIVWVAARAPEYRLRDAYDLFGLATGSPAALIFPLLVTLAGSGTVLGRLWNRAYANQWTRTDLRARLLRDMVRASVTVMVLFALGFLLVFCWCYWVLPSMAGVQLDPSAYGLLTQEAADRDVAARMVFGSLAEVGPEAFALASALFYGIQAAAYSLLALGVGLVTGRPLVAVVVPFIAYHAESLVASLAGEPRLGLYFLAMPASLVPGPISGTMTLLGLLLLAALAAVAPALVAPTRFRSLQ